MSNTPFSPKEIALLKKHGPQEIKEALEQSHDLSTEPKVTCRICFRLYYTPDEDDLVERPVITICGHYFGEHCIAEWLRNNQNRCPFCRTELKFKVCGHNVLPLLAFRPTTPEPLPAQDIPDECYNCEYQRQKDEWMLNLRTLERERSEYAEEATGLTPTRSWKDGGWEVIIKRDMAGTEAEKAQVKIMLRAYDARISELFRVLDDELTPLMNTMADSFKSQSSWQAVRRVDVIFYEDE